MVKKTVLITGAAKRIGKQIALFMADNGWNIAMHYNSSEEEAKNLIKELENKGVKAASIQADLSKHTDVARIFPEVNKRVGVIECLINNASVFENDNINNITEHSWDKNITVNLKSSIFLIKEFVTQIGNNKGNIINILDYAVLRYPENFLSYTISKSALWAATQQLAINLAKKHIRINAIGPGNVLPSKYETEEKFNLSTQTSPLGINTDPMEICRAINFILSSPSLTGQIIALDSGKHLIGPEAY